MKRRTLARHGREGLRNIGRNGWMSFASISAVTIMLLVVGAFGFIILNMSSFIQTVENEVEIRAFIEDGTDADNELTLIENIETLVEVESVTYLDRDEGLDQFIDSLGSEGAVYESIREENPLPDALIVQATDPQHTEALAMEIESMNDIETVEYGESILAQLFSVTNFIRIAGVVLVIGLIFTSIFLISNTIKLTILSRKDEIQIMKLVGATNSFVRFPFFIEGLLIGVIGAIVPIAALIGGYVYLYDFFHVQLPFISLVEPYPLVWQVTGILFGLSVIVGIWGSQMSVRKFLKV